MLTPTAKAGGPTHYELLVRIGFFTAAAVLGASLISTGTAAAAEADPLVPGPLTVAEAPYNLGDTAFRPTSFSWPVELAGQVYYPEKPAEAAYPVVVFLHGRHSTCMSTTSPNPRLAWPCPTGYVLFRIGDRCVAEDMTSETFLRALRRIGTVSYQGRDVGAWFITIARNLILDHVKSSRYRFEVPTAELGETREQHAGPEQSVVRDATNAEVLRCVEQLNTDQRECIVLRFLHGLSVAETAEAMNRNEGAIKALQHRAVRKLAQLIPQGLR